jgi:hypothetical protein
MKPAGQPLRFLTLFLGGWIGLRALALILPAVWSVAQPNDPARQLARRRDRDGGSPAKPATLAVAGNLKEAAGRRGRPQIPPVGFGEPKMKEKADMLPVQGFGQPQLSGPWACVIGEGYAGPVAAGTGATIAPAAGGRSRWSAAAWLLWRPEMGTGLARAPLLGGSQAGARIDYRLAGDGGRGELAVYGRASRAFIGPSSEEVALGLAWRPGQLPVSLLVERRERLGPGGRSGFALLAAGGTGPRDIAPALEIEGYAQAGIVGLPGRDAFADGKMNLGYRLTAPRKARRVTLGASLSGSVQRGASRLDIGPELKLRLPVRGGAMRLSAEWRTRIAGGARPGSGPAVTLVAQF